MIEERKSMSVQRFARMGDFSDRFVRDLIYRREVYAVRCGGVWRIPVDEANRFLGLNRKEGTRDQEAVSQAAA
jgi:hypothetical protein